MGAKRTKRSGMLHPRGKKIDNTRPIHFEPAVVMAETLVQYGEAIDAQPLTVKAKPLRNDPCPCGSGKKFKKCCRGGGQENK